MCWRRCWVENSIDIEGDGNLDQSVNVSLGDSSITSS
jgi:hypothetical protein